MCREDKFVSLQIHGSGKEILSSERYSKHFKKELKNRTFLIIFLRTELLNFEIGFFQKYLFGNNLAVFCMEIHVSTLDQRAIIVVLAR